MTKRDARLESGGHTLLILHLRIDKSAAGRRRRLRVGYRAHGKRGAIRYGFGRRCA